MSKFTLRPYQEKAVSAAISSLERKKNGIIVLPTGSGKSLVIAEIANRLGGKTIVLQPTKEILEQNLSKMKSYNITDIGIYSASMCRKYIGRITFATIGTIIKRKSLFESFDRVIVDECHRVNSKGGQYEEFINHLGLPTLGLTATPYRMRNYRDYQTGEIVAESRILTRTRPRIFSNILHITQPQELFKDNYLCPLNYVCQNDYDSAQIKSTTTGQGFDDKALLNYNSKMRIPERISAIVNTSTAKHILVFTKYVSESEKVLAGIKNMRCAMVQAETDKHSRDYIVRYFRHGQIRCVVNVGVLTTGFDFPELDCVILGRPTKSVALYYQMAGRGIRPSPGKQSCQLIDLTDNVKRFGKIETFELYNQNNNGMWRLKSDRGNLTGINIITGEDLEDASYQESRKDRSIEIPFGKFKGKPVADVMVPLSYLRWGSENLNSKKWKALFKAEYERRTSNKNC